MIEVMKGPLHLEGLREITEAQRAGFRENGHLLTHGLFSGGEIDGVRRSIGNALKKHRLEKRRPAEKDSRGKAFLRMKNLWSVDEGVRQLVLSQRVAGIAASLLGVGNVRLYHDQAVFREPGAGPTPWHQDQYYWPLDTPHTVTLWIPLTDLTIDMGMITFASGSHTKGLVFAENTSDDSDHRLKKYIKEHRFPITRAAGMRAGDATWHYGATIHHTLANDSDRMREVMTVIYMADGARITNPKNKWQVSDRANWLMDLPTGRLAASALNPLLL